MKYRALVWDIDGTLLNTLKGLVAAYQYTIEQLNLPEKSYEEIATFIGPTPQTIFVSKFGLSEIEAQNAADVFRDRYKNVDLLKAEPYSNLLSVLESFSKMGYKQAVATNKRQDYAVDICKYFGLDKYCQPIYGADNFNKLSKAELIKNCLKDLEVADNQVVMIGDTIGDKVAAEQAGVGFIGVNYGFGFKNIEGYANSPSEILDLLKDK